MFALVVSLVFRRVEAGDIAHRLQSTGLFGRKEFTSPVDDALKDGSVVVYSILRLFTGGCNLQAHTFAENR